MKDTTIFDLLLVLVREKRLLVRSVVVFVFLAVFYAVFAPTKYTSEAQFAREAPEQNVDIGGLPSGLGALAGSGLNLGGAEGIGPNTYPDVLESRSLSIAVARDTFSFPEHGRMTFFEHHQQPGVLGRVLDYTLWLPWTIKGWIGESLAEDTGATDLTTQEEEALEQLSGMMWWSEAPESNLMTLSVEASHPRLAKQIATSYLDHLRQRVQMLRTESVRQNLEFIEKRFKQAEDQLREAENKLAEFTDRNRQIQTARLQTERERLQRQVTFASELFRELRSQKTQAELKLQRREPVLTIVDEPLAPAGRSAPRRTFLVLIGVLVGGIVGVVGAFVKRAAREEDAKVDQIKRELLSW
jgi:uncharacterized protein involved in exopolysaccharide biosynthesis